MLPLLRSRARLPRVHLATVFDAFWRAAAYCLHPKVVAMSLVPLLLVGGTAWSLGWLFWESAVDAVRAVLERWTLIAAFFSWLDAIGASGFHSVIGPLLVVALAVPLCVVASLVVVALTMTPAVVRLVAHRRFPLLERRHGGGFWASAGWSLWYTSVALVALAASLPLWFIPPLVLVVPPLIWGWLTYRVFAFDVLADHAEADERRRLVRDHRVTLLGMGIVAGFIGAAPSLLWAVSAMTLLFAPLLILVSIWLYTLVFAFSALWFAHYLLAALRDLRAADAMQGPAFASGPMAADSATRAITPQDLDRTTS